MIPKHSAGFTRARNFVKAVRAADLTVPEPVLDAERVGSYSVKVPDTSDARASLQTAKTEADFHTALAELARAAAVAEGARTNEFSAAVRTVRDDALVNAALGAVPDVLAEGHVRFDPAPLVAALDRVPTGLAGMRPADVPQDVADALSDARRAFDPMGKLFAVVETAWYLVHGSQLRAGGDEGARRLADLLGQYPDEQDAANASGLLRGYYRNAPELALGAFAPWSAVIRVGGTPVFPTDLL